MSDGSRGGSLVFGLWLKRISVPDGLRVVEVGTELNVTIESFAED